ncbi:MULTISPECIES: hypothetical protein [unclassified Streptomyces]|uniref:hypothetical protein n=1 Tax=unclassified Streptomyces TaxID=2593676 RepID=UPI00324B4CBD
MPGPCSEEDIRHAVDGKNLAAIRKPVEAAGHPVTFWEELPPYRHGGPTEGAQLQGEQ